MDNQYLYIILAIVIIYILYINFNKKENFTQEETLFAQKLLDFFKNKTTPSFIEYLEELPKLKNIYDNLISKGVYDKFISKGTTLNINDVLQEMK